MMYPPIYPYRGTFPKQESNSYAYHPSREVMPQMTPDPSKHPSAFVPPPFNGTIVNHPYPSDHGSCCHHSCSPGCYNFRPQFSHFQPPPPPPPPSQPCYYGPWFPSPDAYPPHFISPPHYSVEQPRYDYDKGHGHCCGCPNHTCHRRDDSSPKIEEQRTEQAQDRDASGLIRMPNYGSPGFWVPASSNNEKGGGKAFQLQPESWNGWVPLDVNSLKGLEQEEEGKRVQWAQSQSPTQSPLPIIWMSGYNKPEGASKDANEVTPNSLYNWPSNVKIVPLNLLENGNHERPRPVQEGPKVQVQQEAPAEKETKTKMIPVKHMEDEGQKRTSSLLEEKQKVVEVNKASEMKKTSPTRASKLPPVCLRVDPLPRKTRSNGTSRSPSPPGHKGMRNHEHAEEQQRPQTETKEAISEKVIPVAGAEDHTSSHAEKAQKCHRNIPVVSFQDDSPVQVSAKGDDHLKAEEVCEGRRIGGRNDAEELKFPEAKGQQHVEADKGDVESPENTRLKEKKGPKRDLSHTDAAIIVQSAYRGFEVRRWQPLEKLRKIAKIREQAESIRRQMQSIEASLSEMDAKQRMIIGEKIMNLLLQLDTIQGLHSSAREIRKAVARELVCLEYKLDFLGSRIAAKGHESAQVQEVMMPGNDEAKTSEQESSEQESKQESVDCTIGSIGSTASKQDANLIDLSSNIENTLVTSPSLPIQSTLEQYMQLDEVTPTEKDEENEVPDRSDAETAVVASPSDASVSDSEQGTNLSLVTEIACGQEIMQPGEVNGASESVSSKSKEPDSSLGTMLEEGKAPESGDSTSALPLLVSNGPCDKATKALTSTNEEQSESFSGDDVLGLDEKDLPVEVVTRAHESVEPNEGATVHNMSEKPLAQPLEQESNEGEDVLVRADVLQPPSHEEEESCVQTEEENRSGPEMRAPLDQNEDAHNAQEEHSLPSPVDESGSINVCSVEGGEGACNEAVSSPEPSIKVDDASEKKDEKKVEEAEEPVVENIEVLATNSVAGTVEVAEGSDDSGLLKGSGEEIKDATSEVVLLLPTDKGATDVVGHFPVDVTAKEAEEEDPHQSFASAAMKKEERQLLEANEKLRETLEQLVEAGKDQLGVIAQLNARVKNLEKKLAHKNRRVKLPRRSKPVKTQSCGISCQ